MQYLPLQVISPLPMPAGILTSFRCSFSAALTMLPIRYTCFGSTANQRKQPVISSLVLLTDLQCCSHDLLFSRRTFPDCACPEVTKHKLAPLQPSHCSWHIH